MVIDIITIAIIAISTFLGCRSGFIKLSVSVAATIIAVIAAFILVTPTTNFIIEYTQIDEYIEDMLIDNVYGVITDGEESATNDIVEQVTSGTINGVANSTSYNIIRISSAICIFILVKIALIFVKGLTAIVTKIPGIKQIDSLGGTIYGIIRGIAIVYAILLVAREVVVLKPEIDMDEKLKGAVVTKLMYENNILDTLVR